MADASIRGRFVWHELMTTDTKSAAEFLGKIVGWKTQPWAEDPSYSMFTAGGRPMGGLMTLPDEAKGGTPPTWVTYIGTPNVDETAAQAASLGGKVLRAPADIPTVGRFAILADPQGAMFAAFTPTPTQTPPDGGEPTVGDFSWHELATRDWRAALTFYQRLFGWDETSAMQDPAFGTYQMFERHGRPLGGMFTKPSQMAGPPAWLAYIRVPDAKKAATVIAKLGGKVVNGPMEVPGGDWVTQAVDLQGVYFAVHSLKPAAPKAAAKKRRVTKKRSVSSRAARPSSRRKTTKRAAAKKTTRKRAAGRVRGRKGAAKRSRR